MSRGRFEIAPSVVASAILHGTAAVLIVLFWPKTPPPPPVTLGMTVPVNIVPNGPVADIRPAEQAPEEVAALTPEPIPEAPITPVSPNPAPEPAQSSSSATSKTPSPPKPAPGKGKPQRDLLDDLAATLPSTKSGGAPHSGAQQGPQRTETSPTPRPPVGPARQLSATEMADLATPIQRAWNVDTLCRVEGASGVTVVVQATISPTGYLIDRPKIVEGGEPGFGKVAADSALQAFRKAEPYTVPKGFQQQTIKFRFKVRDACQQRR